MAMISDTYVFVSVLSITYVTFLSFLKKIFILISHFQRFVEMFLHYSFTTIHPLCFARHYVTHYALRAMKTICAIFDAIEIQAFYNANLNPSTSCLKKPIRVLIYRQHALRQSVVYLMDHLCAVCDFSHKICNTKARDRM